MIESKIRTCRAIEKALRSVAVRILLALPARQDLREWNVTDALWYRPLVSIYGEVEVTKRLGAAQRHREPRPDTSVTGALLRLTIATPSSILFVLHLWFCPA